MKYIDERKNGHWLSNLNFQSEDYFGFIYLVWNVNTGRMYVGKKQFRTKTRKIIKGRKNRRIITAESNWKTYTTSSTHVNADIAKGDTFLFEILRLYKTKGGLAYGEVEEMVRRDVLRKKDADGNRAYYNAIIPKIAFIPQE